MHPSNNHSDSNNAEKRQPLITTSKALNEVFRDQNVGYETCSLSDENIFFTSLTC